jgi:hypothetical protein
LLAVAFQVNGPVPLAAKVCVPDAGNDTAAGVTANGCAAETITVTDADFEVSSADVAVTVTFPAVAGAVNTLPANVPALAFHVTVSFDAKL